MAERRGSLERAALAGLLASALLGSGMLGSPPAVAAALAACAIAGALRLRKMTDKALRILRGIGDGLVGVTAVLGFIWTVYPVISEATVSRITMLLALALASLGLVALASAPHWPAGRTLVPASLGLLVIGSLPSPPGLRFASCLGGAAVAAGLFLLVEGRAFDRRAVLPRLASLAAFALVTAAMALGIARFLPWAQPHVETATASMLGSSASSGYAGFSLTSRLGDIEELALSRRAVLRAFTDTPQRLRGRVFTRFDGRAWAAEPARGAADLASADVASLPEPLVRFFEEVPGSILSTPALQAQAFGAAPFVRTRIVQSTTEIETLLSPLAPVLVGMARSGGRIDDNGIVTASPLGPVEIYAFANRYGGPGPGQPAPELTLQLPPSPDPRLLALAEALGGTSGSAEERVKRTLFHLERCCRYSLKVPRPASKDPIAGFLFETQRGYCEYFATAAALLLRLQGVPTRYVTGFNVRDESRVGRHYLVRESDAHAWIESYLPRQGWAEFDPTPSAQYAEVHSESRAGFVTAALERLLALASEVLARLRAGSFWPSVRWALRGLEPLAAFAALALGAILLRRWLAGSAARRPLPALEGPLVDPRVLELLARVDALFRRRGHPRPTARAPLEHLEAVPQGALPAALRTEVARAVDCVYRSRYGGEQPVADEIEGLMRRLSAA